MAGSYSYSRVGCFKQCPYKYKLRYIEGIEPYPNYDPQNALILGTALHTGVETGDIRKAVQEYYDFYPIITDTHVEEAIKLEVMIKKVREMIPNIDKAVFEYELVGDDGFHGFIDCLVPVADHYWDMYDFKYASKSDRYKTSEQLELYRQMFERLNPSEKIVDMYFIVANKVNIKRHRDEDEDAYRRRINLALRDVRVDIVSPDAEISMGEFEETVEAMFECTDFHQNKSPLCRWCEYEKYCSSDGTNLEDVMNLPENTRIGTNKDEHIRFWWYGLPYAGKTYLANRFPNVLMINSDGNTREVDAPRIHVTDVVNPSTSGRTVNKTLAWQVFKDIIEELAKKQNTYETIVVDLVEDFYEHCRKYEYDKLGIEHESDDSFRAWDIVRTEFLSTMRKLVNLPYNIILISHEDTSRDITKKGGDKITAIKPNIQDKVALKLAGMVDVVCRIICDDGKRYISFKSSDVVFGGGRINVAKTEIPCTYEDLMANVGITVPKAVGNFIPAVDKSDLVSVSNAKPETPPPAQTITNVQDKVPEDRQAKFETSEEPPRRRRKAREATPEATPETVATSEDVPEYPEEDIMDEEAKTEAEAPAPKRTRVRRAR